MLEAGKVGPTNLTIIGIRSSRPDDDVGVVLAIALDQWRTSSADRIVY